eukprot:g16780.t1
MIKESKDGHEERRWLSPETALNLLSLFSPRYLPFLVNVHGTVWEDSFRYALDHEKLHAFLLGEIGGSLPLSETQLDASTLFRFVKQQLPEFLGLLEAFVGLESTSSSSGSTEGSSAPSSSPKAGSSSSTSGSGSSTCLGKVIERLAVERGGGGRGRKEVVKKLGLLHGRIREGVRVVKALTATGKLPATAPPPLAGVPREASGTAAGKSGAPAAKAAKPTAFLEGTAGAVAAEKPTFLQTLVRDCHQKGAKAAEKWSKKRRKPSTSTSGGDPDPNLVDARLTIHTSDAVQRTPLVDVFFGMHFPATAPSPQASDQNSAQGLMTTLGLRFRGLIAAGKQMRSLLENATAAMKLKVLKLSRPSPALIAKLAEEHRLDREEEGAAADAFQSCLKRSSLGQPVAFPAENYQKDGGKNLFSRLTSGFTGMLSGGVRRLFMSSPAAAVSRPYSLVDALNALQYELQCIHKLRDLRSRSSAFTRYGMRTVAQAMALELAQLVDALNELHRSRRPRWVEAATDASGAGGKEGGGTDGNAVERGGPQHQVVDVADLSKEQRQELLENAQTLFPDMCAAEALGVNDVTGTLFAGPWKRGMKSTMPPPGAVSVQSASAIDPPTVPAEEDYVIHAALPGFAVLGEPEPTLRREVPVAEDASAWLSHNVKWLEKSDEAKQAARKVREALWKWLAEPGRADR